MAIILLAIPRPVWSADFDVLNQKLNKKYADVEMIGVDEAYETIHSSASDIHKPILLDTRRAAEYAVSHIQGARHAADLDAALELLAGKDKSTPIVLYCSLGFRSAEMTRKLKEKGYDNVLNMEGSIFEWVDKDYPVYQKEREVAKVHPFNFYYARYLRQDYRSYSP